MPTTRIAPTPSGYLHPGNLANFLLNARLTGPAGRCYLRIDDLDRARFRPAYLADIFRIVKALNVPITDGPVDATDFAANWSQTVRLPEYHAALDRLRHHERLFACACSRRELQSGDHPRGCRDHRLPLDAPDVTWRVDTRGLAPVRIPDAVSGQIHTVDLHATMPDFALRRRDGNPAYQLTCVVDDLLFGIDTVGRGTDLLPSTAAQCLVSDLLGYPSLTGRITFVHHPLLTGPDGEKLSKSAGAASAPLDLTTELVAELQTIVTQWLAPV